MRGLALLIFALILTGCGGATDNLLVGDRETKETVILLDTNIQGTVDQVDKARILLRCEIGNVLDETCSFEYVQILYPTLNISAGHPISVSLRDKEEYVVEIPVADGSIKQTEPFLYMRENNPSTSQTGWTIKTDVISQVGTQIVGYGYKVCDNTGTCKPGEAFSGTIEKSEPGTVAIYGDGTMMLSESYIGLLTGAGNGIVNRTDTGTFLDFSILGGVTVNSPVVATYMSPFLGFFAAGQATLTYGDITLTLDTSNRLFKDNSGKTYGSYNPETGKISWSESIGSRGSAVVVTYESEPFTGIGGETVGYGNGKDSVYTIRTKYKYIKDGSLKVFSTRGNGEILTLDPLNGVATVRFPFVVSAQEPIKASYQTYKVVLPVGLKVHTKRGIYWRTLTYTLGG